MRTDAAPAPTRLSDYTPPNFKIESVFLDFDLAPKKTRVRSKMEVSRRAPGSLSLDGEDIVLKSVKVDGRSLKRTEYKLTQSHLVLDSLPDSFTLEIETECDPSANSTLMGLYVSGGRFCTQCEAEGFRRITFYMDRPDVLSVFTVRIEGDKAEYPYLLANGNMTEHGDLTGGRHFAVWHDPFPKPCYLFALVAGEFDIIEDQFTTMSGRDIPLTIYVDPGDAPRALYAMDALKRSMKWDEEAFGREYDLDRFMIVAVRDFNFGAMENKGLNIFNSVLLLADAKTATDLNFERIESVVAHEYFHNWTGNRITCRDWFQLCLKEGFTVFRDQEFSASQRGAAVQRIKDVKALRSRQFPEDAGPLAHPVRPAEYLKIDNFYTATVYEKGAELIRMIKMLLGPEKFRAGCDLYFEKLDGTAATVEEFITCFEDASGQDLSAFMVWYNQAGTPHVRAEVNRSEDQVKLRLSQSNAPTPGQARKDDKVIPVRWQMVHQSGQATDPQLTVLDKSSLELVFKAENPDEFTPSILQDFSAPVVLHSNLETSDHIRLMGQDPNAFNRWESGQTIARNLMSQMAKAIETGSLPEPDPALKHYVHALDNTLSDDNFDNAFKALALTPPGEAEITQSLSTSDPIAVHYARNWIQRAIADGLRDKLLDRYHALTQDGAFSPSPEAAGERALRNRCLSLLADRRDAVAAPLAMAQFNQAENMTDEIAALIALIRLGGRRVDQSLQDFYDKWKTNPLVIDKWFMIAASRTHSHPTAHVETLISHKDYDPRNPNRVRALLGGYAMSNPNCFHHHSGAGYRFFTQQVLDMDGRNPQVAARLLGIYEVWRKLDQNRQALIKSELRDVLAANPSKNVREIAAKTLG